MSTPDTGAPRPATTGADMIAEERARQTSAEGYDAKHDDEHADGAIARAALAYLVAYEDLDYWQKPSNLGAPGDWPWGRQSFKPSSNMACLVKAGALIAAEIDRRLRAGDKS